MSANNLSEWIHFVGIGGTGMSGIAKVLLELGYRVSGSDLNNSEITKRLQQQGALVFLGHRQENIQEGVNLVVISSAIPNNNSEIKKAKILGIPIIQRAEMLARLMQDQKAICVAGAHGKTTTTSMISLILEKNNFDPTVIVGGELNDIGGNAKLGGGKFLVAEADESDGSFLKLLPWSTVITNIENDHLDYYGSLENIVQAFENFVALGSPSGYSILCIDNPKVKSLVDKVPGKLITYGLTKEARYHAENIVFSGSKSRADIYDRGHLLGSLRLNVPGQHNILNALGAIALCLELGLSFQDINNALETFQGVQRRFQVLGIVNGIEIVDDYAHHPTEIKATLRAARNGYQGRVIVVFQPHRYTRTYFLAKEFAQSFADADQVILTEIYSAGEKPLEHVSSQLILDYMAKDKPVKYIEGEEDIVNYLMEISRPGDIILTLGAGNVWSIGVNFLANLEKDINLNLN